MNLDIENILSDFSKEYDLLLKVINKEIIGSKCEDLEKEIKAFQEIMQKNNKIIYKLFTSDYKTLISILLENTFFSTLIDFQSLLINIILERYDCYQNFENLICSDMLMFYCKKQNKKNNFSTINYIKKIMSYDAISSVILRAKFARDYDIIETLLSNKDTSELDFEIYKSNLINNICSKLVSLNNINYINFKNFIKGNNINQSYSNNDKLLLKLELSSMLYVAQLYNISEIDIEILSENLFVFTRNDLDNIILFIKEYSEYRLKDDELKIYRKTNNFK